MSFDSDFEDALSDNESSSSQTRNGDDSSRANDAAASDDDSPIGVVRRAFTKQNLRSLLLESFPPITWLPQVLLRLGSIFFFARHSAFRSTHNQYSIRKKSLETIYWLRWLFV